MLLREALYQTYDQILDVSSTLERIKTCEAYLKDMGAQYYCFYNKTLLKNFKNPFSRITNYPPEWMERYMEKGYSKLDPAILLPLKTQKPCKWDTSDKSNVVMMEAYQRGIKWGFSLPLLCKDQDFSLLTMAFENQYKRDYFYKEYLTTDLQGLVVLFHVVVTRARTLYEKAPLTRRETEILGWLYKGKGYRDIADLEKISVSTVQSHITNIYSKLNVENRAAAIYMGQHYGIL